MLHTLFLAGALIAPAALPAGARDLGPANAATRVRIVVALPPSHADELAALVAAQSDPRSPLFGHVLAPAAARARFAPSQAAVDRAAVQLRAAGFAVGAPSRNRLTFEASAPAPAAARFFRTSIDRVATAAGTGYANVRTASVPAALGAVNVVGLEDVDAMTSARGFASLPVAPPVHAMHGLGPDGGFGPVLTARADDYPFTHKIGKYGHIFDGFGVTIAELVSGVATGPGATNALAPFYEQFGVVPKNRVYDAWVEGGLAYPLSDIAGEMIDEEWMTALAPGANIGVFTIVPGITCGVACTTDMLLAMSAAVDRNADVVNVKYELPCEVNDEPYAQSMESIVQYATSFGISFVTAQGGGAGQCTYESGFRRAVGVPFDSPETLAVTGSALTEGANGSFAEAAWAEGTGGVSPLFGPASFQRGLPGTSSRGRSAPDTVTPASIDGKGPSTYTAAYEGQNAGWGLFTNAQPFANSAATVALVAEWIQMQQGRVGAAARVLYPLAGNPQDLGDITSGCLVWAYPTGHEPPPLCARVGFDFASGLGEPDGFGVGLTLLGH